MPEGVAGVVSLDGAPFKHPDPKGEAEFEPAFEKLVETGALANDVAAGIGWEPRRQLMQRVVAEPDAKADEGEGTRSEALGRLLYDAWTSFRGPGALANAPGGRSRPEVLAALLEGYDRYFPALHGLEYRVLGDHADAPYTPIDDAWGELKIPFLYFGTSRMGSDWVLNGIYTAVASGSEDVTLHVLEDYGHLDLLVGERSVEEVFEPLLAWLRERAPQQAP
jgi:hypothetical protein